MKLTFFSYRLKTLRLSPLKYALDPRMGIMTMTKNDSSSNTAVVCEKKCEVKLERLNPEQQVIFQKNTPSSVNLRFRFKNSIFLSESAAKYYF